MVKTMPVCVLLLLASLTFARGFVWRTPETLWMDAAGKSPLRPRPLFNVGTARMAQGRYGEALEAYQRAEVLSMAPGVPPHEREMTRLLVGMNIADILIRTGRSEEAHQVLRQAWLAEPGFPGTAVNLSYFYLRAREPDKAIAFLVDGIGHFSDYPWFPRKGSLYVNLGIALQMKGDCEAAREAYSVARRYPETFREPACS